MPNRPASQPVNGVMSAAATTAGVATQAIWSCASDRLPCMCGSATLAIVVSTPCMNVASMIEILTARRFVAGARLVSPLTLPVRLLFLRLARSRRAEQFGGGVLGPHH